MVSDLVLEWFASSFALACELVEKECGLDCSSLVCVAVANIANHIRESPPEFLPPLLSR